VITNIILDLVQGVVSIFAALLPHLSVPSWFTTDNLGGSLATSLGSLMAPLNHIFPIDALLTVLSAVLLVLPVVIAYEVFQWAWNHIPSIAGFGTH